MLRIFLIVAILAGIAASVISFTKVQDIITTTRAERDDWHKKDTDEIAAHTKTKKSLKDTTAKLESTEKELTQTKSDLDTANSKVTELTKKSEDLSAKLAKTSSDLDDAQAKLQQWSGLPDPPLIRGIIADLEKTRKAKEAVIAENKLLAGKVTEWENRWNDYFQRDAEVILPKGLRGKIIAVDPKYDFVVLNIGEDQGAKERGVMMVDREGKLLGKVRIKSVSKDRCVANILPDWKTGEVMEGDEVLY